MIQIFAPLLIFAGIVGAAVVSYIIYIIKVEEKR